MNRQALTFLSLFSLILVLAIYYIVVPVDDDITVTTNDTISEIESLQINLNENRESIISQNNSIIASSSSTKSQINTALTNINETKKITELETKLVQLLKDEGFKEAYVEVNNQLIKVVVNKSKSNNQDANEIIKKIMANTDNKYQVEVKFITE